MHCRRAVGTELLLLSCRSTQTPDAFGLESIERTIHRRDECAINLIFKHLAVGNRAEKITNFILYLNFQTHFGEWCVFKATVITTNNDSNKLLRNKNLFLFSMSQIRIRIILFNKHLLNYHFILPNSLHFGRFPLLTPSFFLFLLLFCYFELLS